MANFKAIIATLFFVTLTACTTINTSFGTPVPADVTSNWRLSDVRVIVPDSLAVSEANNLAPNGDIIWHGDPDGDRRLQVETIVKNAIQRGAGGLNGSQPVTIEATLIRFHALSPRARRTTGGVHKVAFSVVVRDANTGVQLIDPLVIQADEKAFGSNDARDAEALGQTQKVRISNRISVVIASWLGLSGENSTVSNSSTPAYGI